MHLSKTTLGQKRMWAKTGVGKNAHVPERSLMVPVHNGELCHQPRLLAKQEEQGLGHACDAL